LPDSFLCFIRFMSANTLDTSLQAVFLRNGAAFAQAVTMPEWREIYSKIAHGADLNSWFGPASVMAPEEWPAIVHKLLAPFNNAIHILEANAPLASLIAPTWEALLAHTASWAAELNSNFPLRRHFSPSMVHDAVKARFAKHVRLAPLIGIAAVLNPQYFVEDGGLKDYVCDIRRWEKLFGRQAMRAIEDDIMRVAVALGYNEEHAQDEWSQLTFGRTCSNWNAEIRACTKDAVDVRDWLFDSSGKACAPACEVGQRARLRIWAHMGEKVTGEGAHAGWPILSAIAQRALIVHATACASERNWSAWKRLCKAERASMTLEHFKQRLLVAEYYNGH
jgi:hypothetical protein